MKGRKVSATIFEYKYGVIYKDNQPVYDSIFKWVAETRISRKKFYHFATKQDAVIFLKRVYQVEVQAEMIINQIVQDFSNQRVYTNW